MLRGRYFVARFSFSSELRSNRCLGCYTYILLPVCSIRIIGSSNSNVAFSYLIAEQSLWVYTTTVPANKRNIGGYLLWRTWPEPRVTPTTWPTDPSSRWPNVRKSSNRSWLGSLGLSSLVWSITIRVDAGARLRSDYFLDEQNWFRKKIKIYVLFEEFLGIFWGTLSTFEWNFRNFVFIWHIFSNFLAWNFLYIFQALRWFYLVLNPLMMNLSGSSINWLWRINLPLCLTPFCSFLVCFLSFHWRKFTSNWRWLGVNVNGSTWNADCAYPLDTFKIC